MTPAVTESTNTPGAVTHAVFVAGPKCSGAYSYDKPKAEQLRASGAVAESAIEKIPC
jgi:hypothetical protein